MVTLNHGLITKNKQIVVHGQTMNDYFSEGQPHLNWILLLFPEVYRLVT